MAIDNADIEFISNARLEILILSTSVREVIIPIEKLILQWRKIRDYINSPFARVYLANIDSLYQFLWPQLRNNEKLESYQVALTQNFCLYSIANQLKIDVPELCYVPIITIDSHDSLFDRFKAKMFGANDCIAQPFISTELVALVNKHISQFVANTSEINHKDREIVTRLS